MKRKLVGAFLLGMATMSFLIWLNMYLDELWVRRYQQHEQGLDRPSPRWPQHKVDWA
jgi:hypothetical protein